MVSTSADTHRPRTLLPPSAARQDDTDALWFIDKQPLNFLHIDLLLALFPQARIVHCLRDARDTALSTWMQHFAGAEMGYAYDFADIAAVAQGCGKLMAQACRRYPASIRCVRYEDLVEDPDRVIGTLAAWIGVEARTVPDGGATVVISTASAWQARQPVSTRSVGRWRNYAPHLPELSAISA